MRRLISLLLVLTACGIAPARVSPATQTSVFVTASFRDRNNLFVERLDREQVQVFENGEQREVEFMAMDEVPTIFGIIFDLNLFSAPFEDERGRAGRISSAALARNVAFELIDKVFRGQSLWAGVYRQRLQVVSDVTTDGFVVKGAVSQVKGSRSADDPFLYSALFAAIQKMSERHEKRRVIVLLLDSLDVRTVEKLNPLKNLLSNSNVELFVVFLGSKYSSGRGGLPPANASRSLKELAQVTCGDLFVAADFGDHPEDLNRRLQNQLRTLYTLGFKSQSPDNRAAKMTIRCTLPGSKVLHHPFTPRLQPDF